MLTRIDSRLWLDLDRIVLIEIDESEVIVKFASPTQTDCFEGPAAGALINALERPTRRRRRRQDFAAMAIVTLLYAVVVWWLW